MAHSKDLRERVVRAYIGGHVGSYRQAAEVFQVGEATVKRWVWTYRSEGRLEPLELGGAQVPRKITAEGEAFIEARLLEEPTLVSQQLCDEYESRFGIRVSTATMKRSIRELGFTVKRGAAGPLREIGRTSRRVGSSSRG